jgi:glycosyltransferase involved in cell wall biosynthesis
VITPDGPWVAAIEALGAEHLAIPLERFIGPVRDLMLFLRLLREFRRFRPDIVHTVTIKPNTIGALAAAAAGVPRIVCQVPGLGYVFGEGNSAARSLLRMIVESLYRSAFRRAARVWFLNPDDCTEFVNAQLVDPRKAVVIRSSGVNIARYAPGTTSASDIEALRAELGIVPNDLVVFMAGRLTWSKGVREFVAASRIIEAEGRRAFFLLAGPLEPSGPDPVPEQFLLNAQSPTFRWIGERDDIPLLLNAASIVVSPSAYREGIPRILLESLAAGKPIVTTDMPGCRETVESGRNGFLVPPHDASALAAALRILIDDGALRESFGRNSSAKAEEFSEDLVAREVLSRLYVDPGDEP